MLENSKFNQIVHVQAHQLSKAEHALSKTANGVLALEQLIGRTKDDLSEMSALLGEADSLLSQLETSSTPVNARMCEVESLLPCCNTAHRPVDIQAYQSEFLETIQFDSSNNLDAYFAKFSEYAQRHRVDVNGNITSLLTRADLEEISRKIDEEFTYKNARCDMYDYMIAATSGLIGGLIDIIFVGIPGDSPLTKLADSTVDSTVETFASFCGWKGPLEGKNPTKSAITFLEHKFLVNYDHRHSGDVGRQFDMSTRNHHIKNLAHSPDIIGLFFSILDQFTNTAHFVSSGKIIAISTENFELSGSNFISKVFSGFVNWLGHLFSDMAGSSGAQNRGSGIPIPFFDLLQFVKFGEFGQYKQSFNVICIKVFEQGYDFRHGLAMTIPVVVTEMIIKATYIAKQHFYSNKPLHEALSCCSSPEMRRMLLVGHGTLCVMDGVDAALGSGGEIIAFLLRTNLIAWFRFGTLAYNELLSFVKSGHIDAEKLDKYIYEEYKKIGS